jgi:hypothetical protein
MSHAAFHHHEPRKKAPPSTSGLITHLDAATLITAVEGTRVGVWEDRSGVGIHAIQNTTAKRPTFVRRAIGNRPALFFDGVDDYLDIDETAATVFVVGQNYGSVDPDVPQNWVGGDGYWGDAAAYAETDGVYHQWILPDAAGKSKTARGTAAPDNRPHIFCYRIDLVAKVADVWHDGVLDLYHPGKFGTSTGTMLRLGARRRNQSQNHRYVHGYVAEMLAYGRALSDAERRMIEEYLARKYSLWLP